MMPDSIIHDEKDKYFLHFLKYEVCIYIIGIFGAISQTLACVVIVANLAIGFNFDNDIEMTSRGITYSYIGIFILTATSFSEILLLRAINQRILRYIQWWMFSTFLFLLLILLLTVIIGFTLFENGLWISLALVYLIIRLPIQMYFVECFSQIEILHREAYPHDPYKSVLFRRFP